MLFQRLAQFGEQAHVLDGDDGLRSEGLQEFDFARVKSTGLLAAHGNETDRLALGKHRHGDIGPPTALPCDRADPLVDAWLLRVADLHDRAPQDGVARIEQVLGPLLAKQGLHSGESRAVPAAASGTDPQVLAVIEPDQNAPAVQQPERTLGNGVEDRLHVGRRTRDDLEDLCRRGLLLQRFAQLGGAVLDPLLQRLVRLLQRPRRPVELVGQRLQLVAGVDRDAMTEIAAADALSAGLHGADRHQHAAREQRGRRTRDQEAERQQGEVAQAAVDHGLEHLAARQFDEHDPLQRRDLGVGGKDIVAGKIARLFHLLRRGLGSTGLGDLGQPVHVGAAQHQRYVGMRDQPALRVDHVGIAVLADLDLGDDVQDQLEVDLGHGDAAVATAVQYRHRQVRLALLAVVNRTEIDLVGDGFGEGRIGRAVDVAADHVHAEPRDLELLVAVAIELGELCDRRRLALQADIFEAALLDRQGGPLRIGDPADLVLDLAHERFDLLRRGLGLLALHVDRGPAIVLVDEGQVERGIDDEHERDQPDEGRHVLEEEPAPHRTSLLQWTHSITSVIVIRSPRPPPPARSTGW